MNEDQVYLLYGLPRLLQQPLSLSKIGWLSNHIIPREQCIGQNYLCLSFNRRKYDISLKEDSPTFSYFPAGTLIAASQVRHDEIYFSYPTEQTQTLVSLLQLKPGWRLSNFRFNDTILTLCARMRELLGELDTLGTADALDALALQIFAAILAANRTGGAASPPKLNLAIYNLAEELTKGVELETLIRKYGYSRRSFYREWNSTFKLSPIQYKLRENLMQARSLLIHTSMSIEEICNTCNFADKIYFYQAFRNHVGCSPGEYRKRHLAEQQENSATPN